MSECAESVISGEVDTKLASTVYDLMEAGFSITVITESLLLNAITISVLEAIDAEVSSQIAKKHFAKIVDSVIGNYDQSFEKLKEQL